MNEIGLTILALTLIVVLVAPRKWALLGMMAGVLYITQGQKFEVFGFNIFAHRFLEIAGFARVIARGEFSFRGLNKIDRALLLLYCYTTLVYLLRSDEPAAYLIGSAVDAILSYFCFRGLIAGMEEFRWFLWGFLFLMVPYMVIVFIERLTGHNAFAFMGGIIEGGLSRDDRIRCWGSFRHPILLGTFGASFIPLYVGMFFAGGDRLRALVGAGLCSGIVWASNSGGPLTAFVAGVVGWLLWWARYWMRWLRLGFLGTFAILAILMKAPVWYLLARISDITGGTGWHRAYLIDISFQNLEKWWLAGMPFADTHDWFPYTSPTLEGADVTNMYIAFGLTAGLGALALFIFLLARAFSSIGKALEAIRSISRETDGVEFMLWGLGVMLGVHAVSFLGVSYFDQMKMVWFMQMAAISNLSQPFLEEPKESSPRTDIDAT